MKDHHYLKATKVTATTIVIVFVLSSSRLCSAFTQRNSPRLLPGFSKCRSRTVLLQDTEMSLMDAATTTTKRRWWGRRAISKVLKRGNRKGIAATATAIGTTSLDGGAADYASAQIQLMLMAAAELDTLQTSVSPFNLTDSSFIQQEFESMSPTQTQIQLPRTLVLPQEIHTQQQQQQQLSTPPTKTHPTTKTTTAAAKRGDWLSRRMATHLEGELSRLIHNWSVQPPTDLQLQVSPRGNILGRLLRGQLKSDATINWTSFKSSNLQLSSGTLSASLIIINILSFVKQINSRRYPKQFEFLFHKIKFTSQDLYESDCIRNGLETLLRRLLKRVGSTPEEVNITSIQIKNSRVSIVGQAGGVAMLPFEVRSKISTSSRGHVVTFPELEISISPNLGVYIPVLPQLDLDVGHNTRFTEIMLDHDSLRFSATAKVTPHHTLTIPDFQQTEQSYSARFFFDVGKWLTELGRFSE